MGLYISLIIPPIILGFLIGFPIFWIVKRYVRSGKPNRFITAAISVIIAELIWFSLMLVTVWDVIVGDYNDTPGALLYFAFLADSPIVAIAAAIFGSGVAQKKER